MSTITFTTPRFATPTSVPTSSDPLPSSVTLEAHAIATIISVEISSEAQSRMVRRAIERRRERIMTGITIATCSVAAVTAVAFAQLLVVAR